MRTSKITINRARERANLIMEATKIPLWKTVGDIKRTQPRTEHQGTSKDIVDDVLRSVGYIRGREKTRSRILDNCIKKIV